MRRLPLMLLSLTVFVDGATAQFRHDELQIGSTLIRRHEQSSFLTRVSPIRANGFAADSAGYRPRWEPFDAGTIAVQTAVGLSGAAAVGGIVIAIAGSTFQSGQVNLGAALAILIVGSAATAVAIPTGVYYGGNWSGGNGSYGWTMAAGVSSSAAATLPLILEGDIRPGVLVPLFLASGLTGSILGYHLSASPVYEPDSGTAEILGRENRGVINVSIVLVTF